MCCLLGMNARNCCLISVGKQLFLHLRFIVWILQLREQNTLLLSRLKKNGMLRCLEKLHISSHLYTSDTLVAGFPGRTFRVEKVLPFSNKVCKSINQEIPQANITVRNFPLSVDELRKKTKIQEGGNVYLFATTLSDGEKVLVVCRKV